MDRKNIKPISSKILTDLDLRKTANGFGNIRKNGAES